MAVKNYNTNLFNKDALVTIAGNNRARIVKTFDNRIYIYIDGIKYSADANDLFGINTNPEGWLETFIKEYDKEAQKKEFNEPYQKRINDAQALMAEKAEEIEESRTLQEKIKKAISDANKAFHNFLASCGVHFRSSLSGENKKIADRLNDTYWAERMNLVIASNNEYSLTMDNCLLQSDISKAKTQIAFNNVILER